jgi:hypothetical protein
MTAQIQPQTGADIWTKCGPWRFTRESIIIGTAAEALLQLYRRAFEPLKVRAAARHLLTREEFLGQMEDHRVDKYVAWEDSGEPVAIITLTRHLDAVPWISPEYFAARYPEQWARNAVYYLGFAFTRSTTQRSRFLEIAVEMAIEPLTMERAVIAYDVCSYNNSVLGLSKRIAEVLRRNSHSLPEELDSQIYYGVNFA